MPIIVSRVAPGTPADECIPRLNEGDQVLYINGRDVSQHTHEQVRQPEPPIPVLFYPPPQGSTSRPKCKFSPRKA